MVLLLAQLSWASAPAKPTFRQVPVAGANGGALEKRTTEAHCTLAVTNTLFTLAGRPTFLLGISYYGGLAAPEDVIRQDLDDIDRIGLNWIRVWANWRAFGADAASVDVEGREIPRVMQRLKWLLSECCRHGIVVDVTLSRGDTANGPPQLATHEGHRRAVETLVTVLRPWRNWYLDLSNERNIRDSRFTSFADLKDLREAVRALDARRLVTASHGGDISREELVHYLKEARVDFLAPHRPRTGESANQTQSQMQEYVRWMKELNCAIPVHFQEPFRRGYGKWSPAMTDYLTDVRGAKASGGAGWCFHNGAERDTAEGQPRRCFDLRQRRLFDQLDKEERTTLEKLNPEKAASLR